MSETRQKWTKVTMNDVLTENGGPEKEDQRRTIGVKVMTGKCRTNSALRIIAYSKPLHTKTVIS